MNKLTKLVSICVLVFWAVVRFRRVILAAAVVVLLGLIFQTLNRGEVVGMSTMFTPNTVSVAQVITSPDAPKALVRKLVITEKGRIDEFKFLLPEQVLAKRKDEDIVVSGVNFLQAEFRPMKFTFWTEDVVPENPEDPVTQLVTGFSCSPSFVLAAVLPQEEFQRLADSHPAYTKRMQDPATIIELRQTAAGIQEAIDFFNKEDENLTAAYKAQGVTPSYTEAELRMLESHASIEVVLNWFRRMISLQDERGLRILSTPKGVDKDAHLYAKARPDDPLTQRISDIRNSAQKQDVLYMSWPIAYTDMFLKNHPYRCVWGNFKRHSDTSRLYIYSVLLLILLPQLVQTSVFGRVRHILEEAHNITDPDCVTQAADQVYAEHPTALFWQGLGVPWLTPWKRSRWGAPWRKTAKEICRQVAEEEETKKESELKTIEAKLLWSEISVFPGLANSLRPVFDVAVNTSRSLAVRKSAIHQLGVELEKKIGLLVGKDKQELKHAAEAEETREKYKKLWIERFLGPVSGAKAELLRASLEDWEFRRLYYLNALFMLCIKNEREFAFRLGKSFEQSIEMLDWLMEALKYGEPLNQAVDEGDWPKAKRLLKLDRVSSPSLEPQVVATVQEPPSVKQFSPVLAGKKVVIIGGQDASRVQKSLCQAAIELGARSCEFVQTARKGKASSRIDASSSDTVFILFTSSDHTGQTKLRSRGRDFILVSATNSERFKEEVVSFLSGK